MFGKFATHLLENCDTVKSETEALKRTRKEQK